MNFEFSMPLFWLAAAVVFVIIEALTMGLTTIWFAGGAVAALAASLLTDNIAIQIILFFAVSIALLIPTRKLFVKKLQTGTEKTNVDALIGKTAIVTAAIRPYEIGTVKLCGQEWSAVCKDEHKEILQNAKVIVVAIEGVKAVVIPAEA